MRPPLTMIGHPVVLRPFIPDAAAHEPDAAPVVFWDVDGTLILGDTLLPFLHRFAGAASLGRTVVRAMARRDRDAAKAAVLQRVLGGRTLAAVDAQARAYVSDVLVRQIRPDCLRRWHWHRQQGHRQVLASASLELYLHHLGDLLGADALISTRMNVVNGWLTGRQATPNCRGEEKANRVREYLSIHPAGQIWVYANGTADRPTLALADVATRVRPYRTLSSR
jgi:HAD superfamily hydrolase (TIGR01490 family)